MRSNTALKAVLGKVGKLGKFDRFRLIKFS